MSTRGHKFGRQQQSHNDYDDDDDGGYAAYGSGSGGYAGATSSVYEEDDGAFGGHYDDDSDEYDYDDEDDDDDEEDEAGRIDFKCNKLLVKYLNFLWQLFFIYIYHNSSKTNAISLRTSQRSEFRDIRLKTRFVLPEWKLVLSC